LERVLRKKKDAEDILQEGYFLERQVSIS